MASAGSRCQLASGGGRGVLSGERGSAVVDCVTVTLRIPLLPEFIDANTATGQFVGERDRHVEG